MSRGSPHAMSNLLTSGSGNVSPRISQESRTLSAGVRPPSNAVMQPKYHGDEWQLWGSRSGSPQDGKSDIPIASLESIERNGLDTLQLHQSEWIAESGGSHTLPVQQFHIAAGPLPRLGGAPHILPSGAHMPPYLSPRSDNGSYPSSLPHVIRFPVDYVPNPLTLPRNGPFEMQSAVPHMDEDTRQFFRGMPAPDTNGPLYHGPLQRIFRHGPLPPLPHPSFPPGAPSYNAYHSPDCGNYYLAQPLEPFTDFSFRFDGYRSSQGRPLYPIPHPNPLFNNVYSSPHSASMHTNVAGVNHLMMNPIIPDYQAQPRIYYPPRPVQIMHPPPLHPVHLNTPAGTEHPLGIRSSNLISPTHEQPKFLSPSRRLAFHSFPNGRQSVPPVVSSSQAFLPTAHRQSRRLNFLPLPERSALLEDFRSNREKSWSLKDILGHTVEFSSDQYGSRFIQQNLETADGQEKQKIFEEIVPSKVDQLVRDVFGNYVIQKFFEFGTQAQKDTLVDIIQNQIISLSLHIYGCRVVQKAIENISESQQEAIIHHLEQDIFTCIKDAHGNHVIQKLIEVVPPERLTFLPLICENILALSTHPYGCRVLQRCLEYLPNTHTTALLQAIHTCAIELMRDQYGNYVIQFIIEHGREGDKAAIISQIQGNLIKLSQHKYASNVCEKALTCTDSETRHSIINEIMIAPTDREDPVLTMVKDQYANYVLQRALIVVEGQQRENFYAQVKPVLVSLQKSTTSYSRPLVSIERLMDRFFGKQSSFPHSTNYEKSNRHGRSSC